ncbi:Multiprotein-bridging factor 1b [Tritrichomonas foetus]|uniref:Multiprotein-bridging factor 1b n=1 Tax=Tritrichomonas foetus TaxID=1144522 RepID=A0A1J4K376_9EUKA|nr:Multiprotein-bridging factor 1b [Tritrichomonas foetus]|eukprot:OHT04204.1 Multiprotein-bridging factor 1b [Tritrichomonas foetus]
MGEPFFFRTNDPDFDPFNDTRTYIKIPPPPGSNAAKIAAGKPIYKPDAATRRMNEIDNNTECFEVERSGMEIANRMKSLRSQKEMTQKELAHRASVKIDVVRDYENGKALPDAKIIARFEQILGGPLREKTQKKKKF